MNKAWVIIPAAGVGKRMQADCPKQYLELEGKTILEHTIDCFSRHAEIAGIVIVLHPQDPYWEGLQINCPVPVHIAAGGRERADSVFNGLKLLMQIAKNPRDYVLVHDAARPCLLQSDIDKLLKQRTGVDRDGALLAMPVRDTMKRERGGRCDHTVEREGLWHALTPQMFPIELLHGALGKALSEKAEITDEASALEYAGRHPRLVEGRASNIKITRPDDLQLASFFLQRRLQP